jgi:hypothetical protein
MVETVRTEQLALLPEYQEQYLKDLLASTTARVEQPLYVPERRVAPLTPAQQQAINLGISGVGSYFPMMQAGEGTIAGGVGTYEEAIRQALGAQPYLTAAGEQVQQAMAGAQPFQASAQEAITQALQQAQTAPGFAAQPIAQAQQALAGTTGQFAPEGIGSFMSQYEDAAVQQALSDIRRQGDIAGQGIRSQAVGAGAFGGSRQAVAEQELGRNVLEQQGRTAAQMRTAGFESAAQRAQQAFEQQQARAQQAATSGAGLGVQQAQLGLQGAGQAGALGQGLAGLGTSFGQLGLQGAGAMGSVGQAFGQLGQGLGTLGGGMAKTGLSQAALGESAQAAGQRDINALLSLGGLEQQQAQQQLEAQRGTEIERQYAPYQQLSFMSDIFRGVPSTQQTLTQQTAPSPSTISQIAGLGVGLAGLNQSGVFDLFRGGK